MTDELPRLRALARAFKAAREADDAWDRNPADDILAERMHEAWTKAWFLLEDWEKSFPRDLPAVHLEE